MRRFVAACMEVVNGYRPPAHLRRLTLPGDASNVIAAGRAAAHRVGLARSAAQRRTRGPGPAFAVVGQLNICEPRPGAVEAVAVLAIPDRSWALALRIERHGPAWLATVMYLV